MVPFGSIHGRFQPFHNAHLAYARAALRYVDRLYVGLTNMLTEHTIGDDVDPHRFESSSNPLTYFQRAQVTTQALIDAGIAKERFEIGPFPVEAPECLAQFWPRDLPCFTTIVNAWNRTKIRALEEHGYSVTVLDDLGMSSYEITSGTEIRALFRRGDQSWRRFVPVGTATCLTEHGWTL